MLAYVFSHWRQRDVSASDYEERQRGFHAALAAAPASGSLRSFSVALSGAPWAAGAADSYEDWYLIEDYAALGVLEHSAISAARAEPHAAAASVAAGGVAGVYGLRIGTSVETPRHAIWFRKPDGLPYAELLLQLTSLVEAAGASLWMRKLSLGPALEFCVHAHEPLTLPDPFVSMTLPLRQVWPPPSEATGG
ncbi:MAG TPA: hypothetical protein VI197_29810 [Polyangiaceae bacterium]